MVDHNTSTSQIASNCVFGDSRVPERIWERIILVDECWIWTGPNLRGYGQVWFDGRQRYVHLVTYSVLVGHIPDGHQLDHLCLVPPCCNPFHGEPVTQRENLLRANGFSGKQARQTHCQNGHLLAGENLVKCQLLKGQRKCRTCANAWALRNYHERQAARAL